MSIELFAFRRTLFAASLVAIAACGPSVIGSGDAGSDDDGAPIDGWVDRDQDGYPAGIDCDDDDEYIHPGVVENCSDGVDNNCNDLIDTDYECLPPCVRAELEESYLGCRFYAVDLPQFSLDKKYAISVSNPDDVATAHVTISSATGVIASLDVGPNSVATWEDSGRAGNVPQAGVYNLAYRVDSDLPIAAYQFNSLDTIEAASTDASLLFAAPSLAEHYFAMGFSARNADDAFIAVFATEADTQVDITPTAAVAGSTSALLQPFQVLVVTATTSGANLTGSRITADKPIGVFGGNRCANIPLGMSFCDHIEEQIFPRQAIGTHYLVGKSHARTYCNPVDYLRVMADVDNTTVTFTPPVAGPWTLNAGQWMETTISAPVEITATEPVLVGQFLRSSNDTECSDEGDPAFILQVPVDQYRPDYVFLTPPTYDTDYVDIIAPAGAGVMLDGNPVTLSAGAIGSSTHTLTSLVVADGPHRLEANQPVGVSVYGYGGPSPEHQDTQNVSYGYPAGLDLEAINPIE